MLKTSPVFRIKIEELSRIIEMLESAMGDIDEAPEKSKIKLKNIIKFLHYHRELLGKKTSK